MDIQLGHVNNFEIRPIQIDIDPRPIKNGGIISDDLYFNLFSIAPTNTGKTTAMINMILLLMGPDTDLYFFVSTFNNDPLWIKARKTFNKYYRKQNGEGQIFAYTSVKDHEGNHLRDLIDDLKEEAQEREQMEEDREDQDEDDIYVPTADELMEQFRKMKGLDEYMAKEKPKPKRKKDRFRYPKRILVFDDISDELRSTDYNTLLKQARNFQITTLTGSQYIKDLQPASRLQIRVWMIFGGMSDKLLLELHTSLGISLPFPLFHKLYQNSTIPTKRNPKPFFVFRPKSGTYGMNFNKQYRLPTDLSVYTKVQQPEPINNDSESDSESDYDDDIYDDDGYYR